jgi:AcrR family transcriptional regulator
MTPQERQRAERIEVRRSRERILSAAESLCASGAAGLTMSALAAEAGVGSATLYRRFPDIPSVLAALHARFMDDLADIAELVAQQPSGWDAVVTTVTGIAQTMIDHPAMPHVYRFLGQHDPDFRLGAEWEEPLAAVIAVAQQEGALRADVGPNDVAIAAFRLGEFAHHPEPERSNIIARQLALTIDGLRASAALTPLPGHVVTSETVNHLIRLEGRAQRSR